MKAFYRLTLQSDKLALQIVADKEAIFEEGKKRLDNLRAGKKANDHHSGMRQAFTDFVDGEASPTASNVLYVAGVSLFITSAVVAAPPVGIAAAAISGVGVAADRLTGAHEKRAGLRDVERCITTLHALKAEMVEKGISDEDPLMRRIESARENLFEKYSERFCENTNVSILEFKRGEASPTEPEFAERAREVGAAVVKQTDVFETASSAAEFAAMSDPLGVFNIATGTLERVAKLVGRADFDRRVDNVRLASEVIECVKDAETMHGITLADKKSVGKVQDQVSDAKEYIKEWRKTNTSLRETRETKKTIDGLIADLKEEMVPGKISELKEVLREFCEQGEKYKDPKILAVDRFNPSKTNPIKKLASSLEKLSTIDLDSPGGLSSIEAALETIDQQIERAKERNNKLVGTKWIAGDHTTVHVKPAGYSKPTKVAPDIELTPEEDKSETHLPVSGPSQGRRMVAQRMRRGEVVPEMADPVVAPILAEPGQIAPREDKGEPPLPTATGAISGGRIRLAAMSALASAAEPRSMLPKPGQIAPGRGEIRVVDIEDGEDKSRMEGRSEAVVAAVAARPRVHSYTTREAREEVVAEAKQATGERKAVPTGEAKSV